MQDRLLDAIRRIIRAEFPRYTYSGVYEYAIQATDGSTINGDPTDTTIPLPSLQKVPLKPGITGSTAKPTVGKLALIMFINSDPARPICVSCEGEPETFSETATATGTVDAPVLSLGSGTVSIAGGGPPAARLGDAILAAGIFAGNIIAGSAKTTIG